MDMSEKLHSQKQERGGGRQALVRDELVSRTCDLQALYAIHVEARIHHPALLTGFHGTRTELQSQLFRKWMSRKKKGAKQWTDRVPRCGNCKQQGFSSKK